MDLETFTFKISGRKPLMQDYDSSGNGEDQEAGKPTKGNRKAPRIPTNFEQATAALYPADEEGHFWHPTPAFSRVIESVCPNQKIVVTVLSTGDQKLMAANTMLPPNTFPADEHFVLCDPDTMGGSREQARFLTKQDWVMDSRRVGGAMAKRPMKHRPKWRRWGGYLEMTVNKAMVHPRFVADFLNEGGMLGIGSGRDHKHKDFGWVGLGMGKFQAELME